MYLFSRYHISPTPSSIYSKYISATNPKPKGEGLGAKGVQTMLPKTRAAIEFTIVLTMALSLQQ